jgi:choline dehydrogenase-like flavoprotein
MPEAHDVIIVGSGAGGGAAAWALASRGVDVLLLEAGPAYDPFDDYRLDRPDWEHQEFPHKVPTKDRQTIAPLQTLDPQWSDLRSWNKVFGPYTSGDTRVSTGYSHVVGLGGSTLHFTGEAHRMHPQAMAMRSRFGVAADWPVTYDELEPFYAEAERIVGVAGPAGGDGRPGSTPYPLPPHRLSYATQKIASGCEKLGWPFVANVRAALSQRYDGRPDCNYCGNCNRGCPRTDKGSVDVTFIPKARATGHCTIRTECQATRVLAGPDDRVTGVDYIDSKGNGMHAEGRAVIVACGAVETPRLLLNSAGPHAPQGLANESGQVGRNFMETLYWLSSAMHPERLGSHRGLPADGICWQFNAPDTVPGVIGGFRFGSSTREIGLNGPIAYAQRAIPGWGQAHKAAMRDHFGCGLTVGAVGECLPHEGSFIDLDPTARDAHGQPKARIHSHLGEMELHRLTVMAKTCRDVLTASGAGDVFEEYGAYDIFHPTHVFGTCRMGNDPADSVVDRFGVSHRWRNLVITDASVFPSSGGGESPSLTIEALAIRAARHLADRSRRGAL